MDDYLHIACDRTTCSEGVPSQDTLRWKCGFPLNHVMANDSGDGPVTFTITGKVSDRLGYINGLENKSSDNAGVLISEIVICISRSDDPLMGERWDKCMDTLHSLQEIARVRSNVNSGLRPEEDFFYPISIGGTRMVFKRPVYVHEDHGRSGNCNVLAHPYPNLFTDYDEGSEKIPHVLEAGYVYADVPVYHVDSKTEQIPPSEVARLLEGAVVAIDFQFIYSQAFDHDQFCAYWEKVTILGYGDF
ncbi:hypothetical protein NP233_g10919 [Leucocoprinus birnbaumii]|uniref:Uncharacterized protein n=1 Tax=Leucocoprinus birnbaumii TaxID=56174 RepID=A0AAD5VIB3_9AGAR|nr:hypothetical protein NP233_g10919 [Leucocoprinus birnbaumii]